MEWRPCDLLVGHQQDNGEDFSWTRYSSGTFLGEQFAYPGLCTRDGRVIFCVWGAKNRGENWRCGVLISEDEGHNPRYQDVAYEDDKTIRHDPHMPAGFNEQTLFETRDGTLVSLIRGRDKLGALDGSSSHSSEALFARCESQNGGQTWSKPIFTNLPGTGAAYFGPTLPDGSLLLASRLPTTWSRHDDHDLYGLLLARSFDDGLSWEPELIFRRDPEGAFFDDYYNAMNGQWIMLDENRALYVFGYFQHRQNRHRVIALQLSWK